MFLTRMSSAGLAIAAILAANPLSFAQERTYKIHPGIVACLTGDGVDPNDESALVAAVWGKNPIVAGCAARVLSGHAPTPTVESALLAGARSPDFQLAGPAASALAAHRNYEWVDDMVRRLPDIKDPLARIRMAGLLAKSGRYEGWEIIRSAIVEKQKYQTYWQESLWEIPDFKGMTDAGGKPVNLELELDRMHTVAPPEVKDAIRAAMIAVGSPPPDSTPNSNPPPHM